MRARRIRGRAVRLQLVEGLSPGGFTAIRRAFRRRKVADDDILDALAALCTAGRIAGGQAISRGEPAQREGRGLPMRIVV